MALLLLLLQTGACALNYNSASTTDAITVEGDFVSNGLQPFIINARLTTGGTHVLRSAAVSCARLALLSRAAGSLPFLVCLLVSARASRARGRLPAAEPRCFSAPCRPAAKPSFMRWTARGDLVFQSFNFFTGSVYFENGRTVRYSPACLPRSVGEFLAVRCLL